MSARPAIVQVPISTIWVMPVHSREVFQNGTRSKPRMSSGEKQTRAMEVFLSVFFGGTPASGSLASGEGAGVRNFHIRAESEEDGWRPLRMIRFRCPANVCARSQSERFAVALWTYGGKGSGNLALQVSYLLCRAASTFYERRWARTAVNILAARSDLSAQCVCLVCSTLRAPHRDAVAIGRDAE